MNQGGPGKSRRWRNLLDLLAALVLLLIGVIVIGHTVAVRMERRNAEEAAKQMRILSTIELRYSPSPQLLNIAKYPSSPCTWIVKKEQEAVRCGAPDSDCWRVQCEVVAKPDSQTKGVVAEWMVDARGMTDIPLNPTAPAMFAHR